jgi:hypothetical protein
LSQEEVVQLWNLVIEKTGAANEAQDCELTVGSTRDDDVAKAAGGTTVRGHSREPQAEQQQAERCGGEQGVWFLLLLLLRIIV